MTNETRATRTFRLSEELAAKAQEIIEVEGLRSAEFFDPIVRDEIDRRHEANIVAIRALRKARQKRRDLGAIELGEAGA